ncbi:hypothetical protein EMMF5_004814 [Cystobasidiomycetes sp. EMM_F5]
MPSSENAIAHAAAGIRRAWTPVPLILRRASETPDHDVGDLGLGMNGLPSPMPVDTSSPSSSYLRPELPLRRSSSYSSGSSSTAPGSRVSPVDVKRAHLPRVAPLPTTLLPPELLHSVSEWIQGIAVVNFDLDVGPKLDNCFPAMSFSPSESQAIAFSSFPDHNGKGDASSTFSWSISQKPTQVDGDNAREHILQGYCYFSQRRDPTSRRGYAQQSLVILTHHASYSGLYTHLISLLGPLYFGTLSSSASSTAPKLTPSAVEAGILNMSRWPPPTPGSSLELAFLGHVINVEIPLPNQAQFQLLTNTRTLVPDLTSSPLLASLPYIPLSRLLGPDLIDQVWLVWELVVLADPLLVYAHDPAHCSELVRWLITIIRPLPFSGTYRPLFHIHMPDFAELLNNNKPRPGLLLGATNPLILMGAKHWPHLIRLAPPMHAQTSTAPPTAYSSLNKSKSAIQPDTKLHSLRTIYKRTVRKDREALKTAQELISRNLYQAADAVLLRSLAGLTERFLVPLNRYFATLLPHNASGDMATPRRAHPFNPNHFLQSLRTHGTPLDFKRSKLPSIATYDSNVNSAAIAFYQRFLDSPNFQGWLKHRSETTISTARSRYIHNLEYCNPETYLQGKGEAEMSDLLERLETEAVSSLEETSRSD